MLSTPSMNKLFAQVTAPLPRAAAAPATYRMYVRDLVLEALVGVYEHERHHPQRIRVNLELDVAEPPAAPEGERRLADLVSYEDLVCAVREILAAGHIPLLEVLAERIAARCLADRRVRTIRVRVEKLDVFPEAAAVGIEIERRNP